MDDINTEDTDKARTLFCGNLHNNVTEDLLYELFLQGGPIQRVFIPKAKTGGHRNFGFVTYTHAMSVPYAMDIFADTSLFNRKLTLKPSSNSKNNEPQSAERLVNVSQMYPNDSLRQGGSGSGTSRSVKHMSYMEPSINNNPLASVLGNQFDPMMLLSMGANLLGGFSNALGLSTSNHNLGGRPEGNSDSLKMKNDRSYGSSNNIEPYNRRAHHSRQDRSRDNDRERYDRRGRDWRDNRNKNRR